MYSIYNLDLKFTDIDITFNEFAHQYSSQPKQSFCDLVALREILKTLNKQKDFYNLSPYVIAGGCLRDIVLGNPPKDWDIFIPLAFDDVDQEIDATLYAEVFDDVVEPDDIASSHYKEIFGKNMVIYNASFHFEEGLPFRTYICPQLISKSFSNYEDLLDGFDHSLTKIACSPTGQVYIHPDFTKSLDTGVITCYNNKEKTIARANKVLMQNPNKFTKVVVNSE